MWSSGHDPSVQQVYALVEGVPVTFRTSEIRAMDGQHRCPVTQRGHHMKRSLARFVRNDSGATAIEYGLIAGIVSVAIIAAFAAFGTDLAALFTTIGGSMNPS